jgi:predicted DNA-binding mobile mystery protein A
MESTKQLLRIAQLDQILERFRGLGNAPKPKIGWLRTVRLTLGMSMRQLGDRLGISPQAVAQLEEREAQGTVTLDSLQTAARAMDMKLVYVLLPEEGSIESMVEARALQLAREYVSDAVQDLTEQEREQAHDRLEKAVLIKALELRGNMGRRFWD